MQEMEERAWRARRESRKYEAFAEIRGLFAGVESSHSTNTSA